ncbi:aspartic peptidase domain-containing protein [Aspergillus varians]
MLSSLLLASQLLVSAVSAVSTNTTASHAIKLTATLYGSRFHAPVSIGGKSFQLLVDTGSSDTFVIEDEFDCVATLTQGGSLFNISQSVCGYSNATYTIDQSNTFERISNESFQAIYGAGIARGIMGLEDIALGGVTVPDQRFGLVNWSTPMNLGASGVLGLAYPLMTSAYELNGTIEEDDLNYQGEVQPYNPLFVDMYTRGLVDSYFSLALKRLDSDAESGDGGQMVLGGLPDTQVLGDWVSVPAEYYNISGSVASNGTRRRSYWATTVQSISYGDNSNYTQAYQTIIDSGAPLSSVPRSVAEEYNQLFSPKGTWSDTQQAYVVDCDATVPDFDVEVGGKVFTLDHADLVLHTGSGTGDEELCLSAITRPLQTEFAEGEDDDDDEDEDDDASSETTELYILGASFLKNVVAVFDFGKSEMRFASRGTEDSAASALEMLGAGRAVLLVAAVTLMQSFI